MDERAEPRLAVVVPAYRVSAHILGLLPKIGPEVSRIYVVDDCCPETSGKLVQEKCTDPRVKVIFHEKNQGVGGALVTGYKHALADDVDIVVKLDGDGQMDPAMIPYLIQPIVAGNADYTKGNRFFELDDVTGMPFIRMVGNAGLSFLTKLSSGYYGIFDPTNGYTAIHARVLSRLRLDKIHRRYFFESDMLYHLGQLRAVVLDVPMKAVYGDETSSLSVTKSLFTFGVNHIRNMFRRVFYSYFLRDFNPASVNLMAGITLGTFGFIYGVYRWIESGRTGVEASSGTVMIAALPFILGIQFLLSFFAFDAQNAPSIPLHPRLSPKPFALTTTGVLPVVSEAKADATEAKPEDLAKNDRQRASA
jgi:dolichol-phosphate mannosyltransferase